MWRIGIEIIALTGLHLPAINFYKDPLQAFQFFF